MNYFSVPQTPLPEQKTPPVLNSMSKAQRSAVLRDFTYVVPGVYTSAKPKKKKRLNNRQSGSEMIRFPNPMEASRLNAVYNLFKEVAAGSVTATNTVESTGAVTFQFSQIGDYTSLSAVFDQYRIAALEVTFVPRVQENTSPSVIPPMFHTAVDLDDATAVSVSQLGDYMGVQATSSTKQHKHTFVPHVAIAAYSGVFTSFANESAPWIDVASPNVLHYGVKWAFFVSASPFGYDLKIRAHVQLKNAR